MTPAEALRIVSDFVADADAFAETFDLESFGDASRPLVDPDYPLAAALEVLRDLVDETGPFCFCGHSESSHRETVSHLSPRSQTPVLRVQCEGCADDPDGHGVFPWHSFRPEV